MGRSGERGVGVGVDVGVGAGVGVKRKENELGQGYQMAGACRRRQVLARRVLQYVHVHVYVGVDVDVHVGCLVYVQTTYWNVGLGN